MTDSDGEAPKSGISTSSSRRVKNISIHHNTIKNYENGMPLNGANIKAYANILEDFKTGLVLGKLEDSEIYGNTYNASNSVASGIRSVNGYAVGNVKIHNEVFNVTHRPLNFINYNQGADGLLTVEDCIFNSTGFELYLKLEKSLSGNSIESYTRDVDKLKQYFTEIDSSSKDVTKLELKDLQGFIAWINEIGLGARSQARLISGIKSFFIYLLLLFP